MGNQPVGIVMSELMHLRDQLLNVCADVPTKLSSVFIDEVVFKVHTAPGRGEGVMPLYRTHLVWDCSTMAFCMYLPFEKTSSTAARL